MQINKKDLAALNKKLRQIKIGTAQDASEALKYFINQSVKDIKIDAPVDTGNLKRNVHGKKTGVLSGFVESIALGEDGFDYAPVQEYGAQYDTYKRDAKPYFEPNIYKNFKRALVLLRRRNKRTVKK